MLDNIRFAVFLFFIFLLPFNNLNLYIGFEVRKFVWILWIALALLSYRKCFSVNSVIKYLSPWLYHILLMVIVGTWGIMFLYYDPILVNYDVLLAFLFFVMSVNELKINRYRIGYVYYTFIFALGLLSVLSRMGIGVSMSTSETGRLMIFGSNANDLGNWAVVGIILSLHLLFNDKSLKRFTAVVFIPILLVLIASSGSRGSFIFLVACLFLFALTIQVKKRYIKTMILFVFFIAIYISVMWMMTNEVMHDRMMSFIEDEDTGGRDIIWNIGLSMFQERPIFGWGLNGYITEMTYRYGAFRSMHNLFLEYAVNSGLLGLICIILFFMRLVNQSISSINKNNLSIILSILSALIAFKTGGVQASLFFWFLISISVHINNESQLKYESSCNSR